MDYNYTPLPADQDTIRLVDIRPTVDSRQPIQCYMRPVQLSRKPEYTALSYVWGSTENKQTIFLDNLPKEVTINLSNALRDIREDRSSVMLWVDALCLYLDRRRTKYRGNLRLGPLFSEGFRFALVGSILFFLLIPPSRRLACSLS